MRWVERRTGPPDRRKPYVVSRPPTARQLEILALTAAGLMQKEIARELGVSRQTIKNHLTDVHRRMSVDTTAHAVALAIRRGWLAPNTPEETQAT